MKHLQNAMNVRPQNVPQNTAYRSDQVQNNAGGFVWNVSDLEAVKRFLVLGSEGGTYYVGESKLTKECAETSLRAIQANGVKVVDLIVEISEQGRAIKNDTALFLLAMASGLGNLETRRAALNALPKVARTATHLFQFLEFTKQFRGWGRALKNAVAAWYEEKNANSLAYQVVKYRNRSGWSHRDALRKAHPVAVAEDKVALFDYITHGTLGENLPKIVVGFEQAIHTTDPDKAVALIREYQGLPWEALSTEVLTSPKIWKELLPSMPLTALVRNLGRMTANGTLKPMSVYTQMVVDKLNNAEYLKAARVHPMSLYIAKRTYDQGRGDKGSLTWQPIAQISAALEKAFHKAFALVEPTGKRFFIGLDVSGSMGSSAAGKTGISCREASTILALTTLKSEENCFVAGFQSSLTPLNITGNDNMDSATRKVKDLNFGATDCAQPMIYALRNKMAIDTFVIYTDNETWAGKTHPSEALRQYRNKMGINAKLIVVAMTPTNFSIADPKDRGMLDVVGFDTTTPQVISEFSKF